MTSKRLRGISIIERPSIEIEKENKKYFSIMDIAQICDVHYEYIRFVVNSGFIKRVDSIKTKGTQIFIEKKEAFKFNKLYIFTGSFSIKTQYKS